MKAWVINGRVKDIAPGNPFDFYHPEVAEFYNVDVPEGTKIGASMSYGVWINPPEPTGAPPETSPAPRTWTANDVRSKLTLAERVKWDNDTSDFIKTAKIELTSPRELADTTEVLQMLVDAGDISQASMTAILA